MIIRVSWLIILISLKLWGPGAGKNYKKWDVSVFTNLASNSNSAKVNFEF